jgi:radical SAM superfamily enzyme YgiQ (UPF0313 family)
MSRDAQALKLALIWPGGVFGAEGNFGVPQILSLAAAVQRTGLASVTVYDLDAEQVQGGFSVEAFRHQRYDIVAISCYSSYDYLKVMALAAWLRPFAADAWFVVGGYHPSARPSDFQIETGHFDYVVVGEGERALVDLVATRHAARTPATSVIVGGAEDPRSTIPYPFELLERYRAVAARVASQFELYVSRGCPYGCSFCMERSKRNVTWRALTVEEAFEQIQRLEQYFGLAGKTLRITDALFGMNRAWRRELLERLARQPITVDKIWLLTRADLLEREDFRLMSRANVAPGFGLESGDPEILRSTGKLRGQPEAFLGRLLELAEWSREFRVPFGANVIVGLPGETQASLERTARYLDRLFLSELPSVGFFGVDRFRVYPGSAIDQVLGQWQQRTGFVPHRPEWWFDGDQDFLSEWNDPSSELDYQRSMQLGFELFAPRLESLQRRFAYQGPARNRFLATIAENLASWMPAARQRQRDLEQLWRPLKGISGPRLEPLAFSARQ